MHADEPSTPTISQPFELNVSPERDRVVLVPRGELDLATTAPVEHEALDLCARRFPEICLDLREVTFFDSSALRLLVRLEAALSAHGCRFAIVPGDGVARRVLELTSMLDRFPHAAR
jgi:anti-anti-sigma factor